MWRFRTRVWMSGLPGSAFATVNHDLRRQRRSVQNSFRKARIVKVEPSICSKITELSQRFAAAPAEDGSTIRLNVAFMVLTTDIFSAYAFGYCDDYLASRISSTSGRRRFRAASSPWLKTVKCRGSVP